MFFLIRFSYIALLLIFTQLLIPAFRPGGRFLILLIALTATFLTGMARKISAGRIPKQRQVPLCGISIVIALFLFNYYFSGVKLTFLGILVTYLGLVLLELLLPNEWYELFYRKYQD